MERKIYPILMLISFLIMFIHGMIPHTHVDPSISERVLHGQHAESHHQPAHPHDHEDSSLPEKQEQPSENDSSHSFPQHFHHSITDDFDFTRYSFSTSSQVIHNIDFFTLINPFLQTRPEPPDIPKGYLIKNQPLISFVLLPGAIALRAPPSIA